MLTHYITKTFYKQSCFNHNDADTTHYPKKLIKRHRYYIRGIMHFKCKFKCMLCGSVSIPFKPYIRHKHLYTSVYRYGVTRYVNNI